PSTLFPYTTLFRSFLIKTNVIRKPCAEFPMEWKGIACHRNSTACVLANLLPSARRDGLVSNPRKKLFLPCGTHTPPTPASEQTFFNTPYSFITAKSWPTATKLGRTHIAIPLDY